MMNPKLAAAYGAKRMASKGMMKCAHGGPLMCSKGCYAKGGMVEADDDVDSDADVSFMSRGGMASLSPQMMAQKIRMQKMAKGGMVMDDENNEEEDERYHEDSKDF